MGVLEAEIVAHRHKKVVSSVVRRLVSNPVVELRSHLWCVVSVETRIVDECTVVVIQGVKVEAIRSTVVVVKSVSENLNAFTKGLIHRSPNPFHCPVFQSLRSVLVIDSRKEESIEAHLGEQTSVGVGVTEGVYLPAHPWSHSELSHDEFVTCHHVVYHIFVVGTGLIVHGPARVEQLESTLYDELADLVLQLVSLSGPPHREELHFDIRKASCGISEQLLDRSV